MTTHIERRKWARVHFRREIIAYAGAKRLSCLALDLSAGGVCLLPPVRATPGLLLRLNIGFPGGRTIVVDGVLVREGNVKSRYIWGVRFHRVAPRIFDELWQAVDAERRRVDDEIEEEVELPVGHHTVPPLDDPTVVTIPTTPEPVVDERGAYSVVTKKAKDRSRRITRGQPRIKENATPRSPTGPAHPAVISGEHKAPRFTGPGHHAVGAVVSDPRRSDPELEREIEEELDQIYRTFLDSDE